MTRRILGMTAAIFATAIASAQADWTVSKSVVAGFGGPVKITGNLPKSSGEPAASMVTPSGQKQDLRVFVVAQIDEVQSWETAVVLPPNTSGQPQIYKFQSGSEEKTVVVEPKGVVSEGTGVKATYFYEQDFRFPTTIRPEAVPYLDGIEGLPVGVEKRGFSVRWEGSLTAAVSGSTKFKVRSNQSAKVYFDGRRKASVNGRGQDAETEFEVTLNAGDRTAIQIDLAAKQNPVRFQLMWSQNGQPYRLVPQSQFASSNGGKASPRLKVVGDMSPIRVKGKSPAVAPDFEAQSPYGEAEAWTEVHTQTGLVGRYAEGMPVTLPSSVAKVTQEFQLKYVAVDAAGGMIIENGPKVMVDPISTATERVFVPRPVVRPNPIPASPSDTGASANPLVSNNANRSQYEPMARETARRYGLDENIFCKMIETESNWNPSAVSRSGAMGLGQLMPGTAAFLGVSNPENPSENLDGAARYLSQQLRKFRTYRLALAAYNAGPGNVIKHGGVPPFRETQNYVRKILG